MLLYHIFAGGLLLETGGYQMSGALVKHTQLVRELTVPVQSYGSRKYYYFDGIDGIDGIDGFAIMKRVTVDAGYTRIDPHPVLPERITLDVYAGLTAQFKKMYVKEVDRSTVFEPITTQYALGITTDLTLAEYTSQESHPFCTKYISPTLEVTYGVDKHNVVAALAAGLQAIEARHVFLVQQNHLSLRVHYLNKPYTGTNLWVAKPSRSRGNSLTRGGAPATLGNILKMSVDQFSFPLPTVATKAGPFFIGATKEEVQKQVEIFAQHIAITK